MCQLPQVSVTYLNRESQKILVEVFRATSQNVQSSLVSTLVKPVDGKLHTAKKTNSTVQSQQDIYLYLSREMQYYPLGKDINTKYQRKKNWQQF